MSSLRLLAQRAKLGTSGTPVTAESLAVWKAARAARKAAAREAEETEARRSALGLGRMGKRACPAFTLASQLLRAEVSLASDCA